MIGRIQRIWSNLIQIAVKNRPVSPVKMGEKILLLLSAPCTQAYFDSEEVRRQFAEYDLAIVNNMLVYSEREMHIWHPKYVIIFDPVFYNDDISYSDKRNNFLQAVERIDWECYIVTSSLAKFRIKNENVKFIYISPFSIKKYSNLKIGFLKKNIVNLGCNSVIQGALYFAITFLYKEIAILGCTYKGYDVEMKQDGLHLDGYSHYYDGQIDHEIIANEQLEQMSMGFLTDYYYRSYLSSMIFHNIKKYANKMGVIITNYSEGNKIDAFVTKELRK